MIAAGASIETIGVITADRPTLLRRCLRSYQDHCRAGGRHVRFVVIDGSKERANSSRNQIIVASAQQEAPELPLTYVGPCAQAAIRRRLIRHGIPPVVVSCMLPEMARSHSPGSARTLLLLISAGQAILTADDDTVCMPWTAPHGGGPHVQFVSRDDPRLTTLCESRASAITTAAKSAGGDLIAAHEELLGATLSDLQRRVHGASESTEHAAATWQGTVRATWSGIAGDSAVHCPYSILFNTTTAGRVIRDTPALYRLATTSREVVRSVPRPTVTDESGLMAYCAAIDNRTIVPPFSSVGTNEDGLFGAMLRIASPDAFIGHVPCGIIHDSSRPSVYDSSAITSAAQLRFGDLIQQLIGDWRPMAAGCADVNLRALGDYLWNISQLDIGSFAYETGKAARERTAPQLASIDRQLSAGCPAYIAADLVRYRETALAYLQRPDAGVPIEFRSTDTVRRDVRRLRDYIGCFALVLRLWPEIWGCAGRSIAPHVRDS